MQDSAPPVDTAPAAPIGNEGTGKEGTSKETLIDNEIPITPTELPPEPTGDTPPPEEGTPEAPAKGEFKIPDAYQVKELQDGKKQNAWVEKVKNVDDLWKTAANAQQLLGRRHPTPDFETATPQEVEQYFNDVRPEAPDAYTFKTSDDYQESGLEGAFGELLHQTGITKFQGNKLIEGYQALENAKRAELFDADSFLDSMEQSFGNGYEMKTAQAKAVIEANLNAEQKAQLEGIPNQFLKTVYELAHNMQKSYGIEDTGKGGEHRVGNVAPVSVDQKRADLRKQITELSAKPYHTADDKQALIDQLHKTYTK